MGFEELVYKHEIEVYTKRNVNCGMAELLE